jgi:NAD(P)H-dependent FMN reductase
MVRTVLAINGSTRASSSNGHYLHAIERLVGDRAAFVRSPSIADLPHFNPDLDHEDPPASVVHFRQLVLASDAVLICTPEYAMGVVGSLKNALDWLVSSSTLSGKPVMLVTASLNGEKGHAALLETLTVIEARLRPETNVLIPFAKTKVTSDGVITDDPALQAIQNALDVLLAGR